jgi:hypothetical protein
VEQSHAKHALKQYIITCGIVFSDFVSLPVLVSIKSRHLSWAIGRRHSHIPSQDC